MKFESIKPIYDKVSRGDIGGFTVPAFNIRTMTVDIASSLFRVAKKYKAPLFLIEIAPSEIGYTNQTLKDYRKSITKAIKKEKYPYPVFLQGDHFKAKDIEFIKKLSKEAIKNKFYNIDIDGSSFSPLENARRTADISNYIYKINKNVSIGAEVGKIGGDNTTIGDFVTFMEEYNKKTDVSLSKIAIQTGTKHGGIIDKHGKILVPEEDFDLIKKLSEKAKEYGLAGVVAHGASTLPDDTFHIFPKLGVCEIHLATFIQNIVYKHLLSDFKKKTYSWLDNSFEPKNQTKEQFYYRNRKRAFGKFKKEFNKLENKEIIEEIEAKFEFFFKNLNIVGTENIIK